MEKFGWYLHRALIETGHECQIVSWSDYPGAIQCRNIPNPQKAELLGAWIEREFVFDVAVSDGYWGAGITLHPVVPVVHGTWFGFHLAMGGGSPWANAEVKAQHDAFNAMNAYPVACSPAAARELIKHHRRQPVATILHGVDLTAFSPRRHNGIPVVLHAATNDKKGKALLPGIRKALGADFDLQYLDAKAGEEPQAFQRGAVYLHPSQHEGNAYALLEALATGLPIVTSNVGLFEAIADKVCGRILWVRTAESVWAEAVREVWGERERYGKAARELAYELADFEDFKRNWVALLMGGLH